MRRKHIRRLAVKNGEGKITGTITLMSIVGNVPSDSVDLADIELPNNVAKERRNKNYLSLLPLRI